MVAELLKTGRDYAVSSQYLMDKTGLSRRGLYKQIEEERKTELILSNHHGGYYLADPDTPEGRADLKRFEAQMKSMAISCFGSSKLARSILKNWERSSGADE